MRRRESGAFGVQRAHVVQAVGQLDQDHAHVARHRQHHLAETFGIGFLAVAELDLVELGDAFDQFGHALAEGIGDERCAAGRVFQGVMQDGGAQSVSPSRRRSARISATAIGWVM